MVFLKTWGEIDERLDPAFYLNIMLLDKNIVSKSAHPVSTFKQKIKMQRGRFGHRPRNDPRYYDGVYPFIQTGNIVKASTNNETIEFTQTLNELGLSTSRLFDEKAVVITIAANIGYTAILDYPACFPDSLVAITSKDNELSLEYLNVYIRFIREYIENIAPQAAQKNINLKQLSKLPVIIPDTDTQKVIVSIMEKAYTEKIQKEKEAQSLLDSIDDYLLQEFGINMPSEEANSLDNRMFWINSNKVLGTRFDPYYHKPIFTINLNNICNCRTTTTTLRNIISGELTKGILPNEAQKDGEYKVIQINSINNDGTINISNKTTAKAIYSSKHRLEKGDVLVVITGATIGKIGFWDYEGEYYLGGDIVKFNTGNYYLNEIYAALLRTQPYQLQIKRCITGATNGHLAPIDIEALPLPIIHDRNIQEKIAKKLSTTRVKVKSLELEAGNTVKTAKIHMGKILFRGEL